MAPLAQLAERGSSKPEAAGSNPAGSFFKPSIAQLVEHGIVEVINYIPGVVGSNPARRISNERFIKSDKGLNKSKKQKQNKPNKINQIKQK